MGRHDFSQSLSKNLDTLNLASNIVTQYFKATPFIPNQGNHDTFPIDQTLPYLKDKIRSHLAQGWEPLIGKDNTYQFSSSGYFKTKISGNLHIISINSIEYDGNNLFRQKTIRGSSQDIWLNQTLTQLRNDREMAYLLGHIFPSSNESTAIYNEWLLDYIDSFHDVIQASFYGHSHNDEFRLDHSSSRSPPMLVTPSLMADHRDPCFRIYQYRLKTNVLLDYSQYCVDLDQTNKLDKLQVYLAYRFSDEYGLANITGKSYRSLFNNKTNDTITRKYCQHYFGWETLTIAYGEKTPLKKNTHVNWSMPSH